jgi:hypothetical protein
MICAASKLAIYSAVVIALCLACSTPALAQQTTLPPSLNTSVPKTAFIKNQLKIAGDLARKTIAGLEAMPYDDSIPMDEVTLQNARDTYVLIRAARHGMELAKEQSRYPDPVMDVAFKRVDLAWAKARWPVDRITSSVPRQLFVQESIQQLSEAVRLLNQASMLMP